MATWHENKISHEPNNQKKGNVIIFICAKCWCKSHWNPHNPSENVFYIFKAFTQQLSKCLTDFLQTRLPMKYWECVYDQFTCLAAATDSITGCKQREVEEKTREGGRRERERERRESQIQIHHDRKSPQWLAEEILQIFTTWARLISDFLMFCDWSEVSGYRDESRANLFRGVTQKGSSTGS